MGGGQHAHLGRQRPDVAGATAVDAGALLDDAAADDLLQQRLGGVVDLALPLGELGQELVDDGPGGLALGGLALGLGRDAGHLGEAVGADGLDAGGDVVGVVDLGLPLERDDQVGLGGRLDQLALGLDGLADPGLGGLQAPGDDLFGHVRGAVLVELPGGLGAAGLDHHDGDVAVVELAPGHDELEGRVVALGVGGVRDPAALGRPGDAHGADRALEGDARHHERRRGGVDGQHVVGVLAVDADHGHDDLGLVAVAVHEARPQRPVDETAGEDGQVGGPALPPEEAAGDAPGGVHALFDVHRQGEEVDALADGASGVGGDQHLGLAEAGHDGPLALERQLAGLETQCGVAAGYRRRHDDGISHRCFSFPADRPPDRAAGPVPSRQPRRRVGRGPWKATGS